MAKVIYQRYIQPKRWTCKTRDCIRNGKVAQSVERPKCPVCHNGMVLA